jgi:hypothetical protein
MGYGTWQERRHENKIWKSGTEVMEAKKHFSRRGAEAQRRWDKTRYFGIQILEIFIFLRWLAWPLYLHIKNLCASAPPRETFR